jgi:hypothetical protein
MDNVQAQVLEPTNPNDGVQAQVPANGTLPPDLEKFVPDSPTVPATPQDAQAQGQNQVQTGATAPDPNIANLQRIANERQLEIYRLQQELNKIQQQMVPAQPEIRRNPYDPQTDPNRWWEWEKSDLARISAEKAAEMSRNEILSLAANAYEQQWIASHPGVDIGAVKAFAQNRGIRDINDAYALMTMKDQMANVAQTTAHLAFNQARQPTQGAIPLRGSPAGGTGEIVLSFEKLAAEWQSKNGNVNWPPELLAEFRKEAFRREAASRMRS